VGTLVRSFPAVELERTAEPSERVDDEGLQAVSNLTALTNSASTPCGSTHGRRRRRGCGGDTRCCTSTSC
jgi:hypothetical protein